jgi:FAD/FMN-containing dehydrogenase
MTGYEGLRRQISGDLFERDDPHYERLRRGWDLSIDQFPALILVPRTVADVAAGVRFATESGRGIGVQSTGHGVLYPADENLLIITSRMTAVQVNAGARIARVEAGVTWRRVLEATTPSGLAALLGSSPDIGVVGYMLGGGIGWLSRRYGFGADSLRRIDVVTADGILRHASSSENADLFWGLRGGGGNFGVVTAMEFDLYPVPTVYGGNLVYGGELARSALRFYRDWIATVPDELSSWISIMRVPALPLVRETFRGKTLVLLMAAFAGSAAEGRSWIQPWLDWHSPIDNTFREMPFSEVGTISMDPVEPTAMCCSSDMLDRLSDAAIDLIVDHATDPRSGLSLHVLRHAGGAMSRASSDTSAVSNRDARLYLFMAGMTPTPEAATALQHEIQRYRTAVQPYVRGGMWMNFMNGNGGSARARIKEAYGTEAHRQLLALKAKYDPNDTFRFSFQLRGSQ